MNIRVLLLCAVLLAGCQSAYVDVSLEKQIPDSVASVVASIDDDTFASIIYRPTNPSYLVLQLQGTATVTYEQHQTEGQLFITYNEQLSTPIAPAVYAFSIPEQTKSIRLFRNGDEISFNIWK